jgi:hypothetical protein
MVFKKESRLNKHLDDKKSPFISTDIIANDEDTSLTRSRGLSPKHIG